MLVRINKYLASKGVASRRKSDELIAKGLIKINGKVSTQTGIKIDPEKDLVEVDNQALSLEKESYLYFMLNKPYGYITTLKQNDSNAPVVANLFKDYPRVYPVGRLDKYSTGLLLVTNDGDFAYKLTHPSFNKEKEYLVTATSQITMGMIAKFQKGMTIDKYKTKPAIVKRISERQISIILKEGRNRQIRKMLQKVGLEVESLHRIRINKLLLGDLKPKEFRALTKEEVQMLF